MDENAINVQIDKCYPKALERRPWFDSLGRRAIHGAPSNQRNLIPAQRKYQKKIYSFGLRMDDRSTPTGYISEQNGEHTMLMAGKQLASAVYRCFEEQPKHPKLQQILKDGYPVLIRPSSLPLDVQLHIVNTSNQFHDGQSITISELIRMIPEVQAAWLESKGNVSSRIFCATKGEYSYSALYSKFVVKHYNKYFRDGNYTKISRRSTHIFKLIR